MKNEIKCENLICCSYIVNLPLAIKPYTMRHIKESDWQYLRKIKDEILNRHCEAIFEVIDLINENRKGEEHKSYLQIYRLLEDKDKEIAATYNDIKRSNAIEKIYLMRKHLAMTDEEFSKFSAETKDLVDHLQSLEI